MTKRKSQKPVGTLAYCYATGLIGFTEGKCPNGALPIVRGPDHIVRDFISAVARHAYERGVLLVPGVPEAEDQNAGLDALLKFKAWIEPHFERRLLEEAA